MLTAEEQLDYDTFALASPNVTRVPLWKFNEFNPFGAIGDYSRPLVDRYCRLWST